MVDKRRGRDLSREDRDLWKHVTRDAKPLEKREAAPRAPVLEPKAPEPTASKPTTPGEIPIETKSARVKPAAPALDHGKAAGIDRRSTQRLRRGQLPVEATLDLHGYTQGPAHAALGRFLAEAQARGLRCVLIVTGKGADTGTGGVLRAEVPRWLNEPGNRDKILAFDYAQPKHGGLGALYVLMRRQRGA